MYFHELIAVTRFSKMLICSTKCVFHARSRFYYFGAVGLQKVLRSVFQPVTYPFCVELHRLLCVLVCYDMVVVVF